MENTDRAGEGSQAGAVQSRRSGLNLNTDKLEPPPTRPDRSLPRSCGTQRPQARSASSAAVVPHVSRLSRTHPGQPLAPSQRSAVPGGVVSPVPAKGSRQSSAAPFGAGSVFLDRPSRTFVFKPSIKCS